MVIIIVCKIVYDAYRNEQQKALYAGSEVDGPIHTIWEDVGEESFLEGRRAMYFSNCND